MTAVVVKVQRPNIAKQIAEDFEILAQMAVFLEAHTEFGRRRRLREMLEEFRLTIKNELNYEREANVFLTEEGRIALLDLGMVGHVAPGMQDNLLHLLIAIARARATMPRTSSWP